MYFDERDNNMDYLSFTDNNESTYNDIENTDVKIDTINIINYNRSLLNNMFNSKEGLNKGTMFKESYSPYKNYVFKIVISGRKDEMLLRIQELTFKVIDLSLYLDLNPQDRDVYLDFKKALEELKQNKDIYEKNYGPLCLDSLLNDKYEWSSNPWPWMKEGGR